MSKLKLSVIFILALLVFTAAKLPVGLVVQQIKLPKGVAFQGLKGSLWEGSIQTLQVNQWQVTNVRWQFVFSQLFTAKLGFDVKFGKARDGAQISGKGLVNYGLTGLLVENSTVRIPASLMGPMLPLPVPGIGGKLLLQVDQFSQGDKLCNTLDGELSWSQAEVDFGGPVDLGLISGDLSCNTGNVVATFDANNKLGLEGVATVEPKGKYQFDGFLKPDANLPKAIHDGLNMFRRADSKGKYKIKL